MTALLCFVGCALVSWLAGYPAHRVLARHGILDHPNERSCHDRPTVRGGGIAIVAALGAVTATVALSQNRYGMLVMLGGAAALAVVSFLDDQFSVAPALRFCWHAVLATATLAALGWPRLTLTFGPDWSWGVSGGLAAGVWFLWLVGYINAFNFMDGINGLAAGQAVVTGLGAGLLFGLHSGDWTGAGLLLAISLAGAAAGFLPHNFPQARMFMGDVGSAPLGFLLAFLVIYLAQKSGWVLLVPLALLHANYVLDTGVTLARRIARGERWHQPHREHFYQRLIRAGKSHGFVTGLELSLQTVVLGLMVWYLFVPGWVRLLLALAVLVLWAGFFAYGEIAFRRRPRSRLAGAPAQPDLEVAPAWSNPDLRDMRQPSAKASQPIHLSLPHMGGSEIRFVQRAFDENWLSTTGPNLKALETSFSARVGLPSVALSSGTAAIHLAVRLAGVKPGDEVVSPTLTFVASCNPVLYEGARPVFIDSERRSWNLDPELLSGFLKQRAANNRLPKAVIVVHLFGQSADLDPIVALCRQYGVTLIEDAAESLGAQYKNRPVGSLADVGVYSFNGNKIITSTGGGMLASPHHGWVDKARHWSTQACDPNPQRNYLHSEIGYNYRLSNVLAGIALGQLEVLEERIRQRRAIAFRYRDAFADLPGLELMPQAPYGLHTNWLSCFLVDQASFGLSAGGLVRSLNAANIEARPVWKPMHTQKLYQGYECVGGAVAEDLNRRGICLPSSSCLTDDEQRFVIDRVREAHLAAKAAPGK
ncbi:MAG: hypothetical protein FJ387_28835 [Verrucomicrobia bacterium]|nr:hypothetical protein [Verrucomicrobiota bacterium]